MVAEETSQTQTITNSTRGVGSVGPPLPSNPKSATQMRKPPSLSTLVMPSFSGVPPPSQSSIHALAALIIRLPRENRDLLYTLVELIKATVNRSHQTKMPLANLLLVFCPSLSINPNLLRVLCESEDIWKVPPKTVETPARPNAEAQENLDASYPSSAELSPIMDVDSESGSPTGVRPRNMRTRRGPIKTICVQASDSLLSINSPPDMTSTDSSSLQDDTSASDVSLPDVLSNGDTLTRKHSLPLSSSAESLVTPSTSSKPPSFVFSAAKEMPLAPPMIADQSQPPFEHLPQSIPTSPIPFPTSVSAPATPSSLRKSLTFPNLPFPVSSSPSPTRKRSSRPSLNLLFSKKSGSSLRSTSISSPIPQVQLGPKTAAEPRPPVLEVKLNEPPFRFDFSARRSGDGNKSGGYKDSGLTLAPPPPIMSRLDSSTSTESPVSAMYETPEGTPSGSVISLNRNSTYERSSSQQPSDLGRRSRLSIAFFDSEEGENEWSTSVLSAVDDMVTPSLPQVNVTGP